MSEDNQDLGGDEKGTDDNNSAILDAMSKMIDEKLANISKANNEDDNDKNFSKSDSKKDEELKVKELAKEEIRKEEWFNNLKNNPTSELYSINPEDILSCEKKYSDNLEAKTRIAQYLINESFLNVENNKKYLLDEKQEDLFDQYHTLTDKQKQERASEFYELYLIGVKLYEKEKREKSTTFINKDSFSKNNRDPFPEFGKRKFDYLEGEK